MDKKDIKIFEALVLGLLRADEKAKIPRSQIAKKIGFHQPQLNKWLDQDQGMAPKSIERVLSAYGVDVEAVADLIVSFAHIPGFFQNLTKIGKSQDQHLKNKIVTEAEFLAGQTEQ